MFLFRTGAKRRSHQVRFQVEGLESRDLKSSGPTAEVWMQNHPAAVIVGPESFTIAAPNPVTVGGGKAALAAGRVTLSSYNVMKKTEKSASQLFYAGSHLAELQVAVFTKTSFSVYTFKDVMVESVGWSGSSGGDATPTESVSFIFTSASVRTFSDPGAFGVFDVATSAA